MKMIFYDKDGITGMITYLGKNGYYLEVIRDNGEKLLSGTSSGQGVIHHLRSLDHQLKTKAELSEEEWTLLAEKFPWFAEHRPEAEGILRRFLSGLLLYAIRENKKDLTELIIRESGLDRKGLEKREIKDAAILEADCLDDEDTLRVWLKPKYGGSFYGTWKYGSSYVFSKEKGYRIGTGLLIRLSFHYSGLKRQLENWENKENGFLSCLLPGGKGRIAYRPQKESKAGSKLYEFLIIRTESPVFQRNIIPAPSFFSKFGALSDTEPREEGMRKIAETMLASAISGRDRYMELALKEYLETATEDECEFLCKEDGMPHWVAWTRERQVESIEVLGGKKNTPSFFHYKEDYHLKVRVDGIENTTVWSPEEPDRFQIKVYHHVEFCHLNNGQVKYVQKVVSKLG